MQNTSMFAVLYMSLRSGWALLQTSTPHDRWVDLQRSKNTHREHLGRKNTKPSMNCHNNSKKQTNALPNFSCSRLRMTKTRQIYILPTLGTQVCKLHLLNSRFPAHAPPTMCIPHLPMKAYFSSNLLRSNDKIHLMKPGLQLHVQLC